MDNDYKLQFQNLRDEFRRFAEGGCINIDKEMNDLAFNSNWNSPTGDTSDKHPISWSSSSKRATPKSSGSSDSPEESESVEHVVGKTWTPTADDHGFLEGQAAHVGQVLAEPVDTLAGEVRSRKGHKKSRGGCYNCKKRKIKCQENQPACYNCTRKNLQCKYPTPKTLSALQASSMYSASPISSINLQSTPTVFTLTDMRLFHHYLMDAYPHLPVGNDTAWLSQVPLVAHHNQYLMHAILGLAASHLELLTGADLSAAALHHRVQAIKGSSEALSQRNRTGSDGDALLASCYLLTFQSSYMKEGIPDFFQFVRGCSLVSNQLRDEQLPMAFFLTSQDHFSFMEHRLVNLPIIDPELIECAERSLIELKPVLELPVHYHFYQLLVDCIAGVKHSSLQGYFKFISIYQGINRLDNKSFKDFTDTKNTTSSILIAQFLGMQLILLPILDREWAGRTKNTPARMNLSWISNISKSLPAHLRFYVEWPQAVADAIQDELSGKKSALPRVSILRKKEGLSTGVILGAEMDD